MSKKELSYSGWLRMLLLKQPELSLADLQKHHEKAGWEDKPPESKQWIYLQQRQIRKRWGVSSVNEIPRNSKGEIDLSGMMKLYLRKHPQSNASKAIEYFAADGLKVDQKLFTSVKKNMTPEELAVPRKGAPVMRRKNSQKNRKENMDVNLLLKTKKLVEEMGGFESIRNALKLLEAIQS